MTYGDAGHVQSSTLPWAMALVVRTEDRMPKKMGSFLPVEVEMLVLFFTNLQSQMSAVAKMGEKLLKGLFTIFLSIVQISYFG